MSAATMGAFSPQARIKLWWIGLIMPSIEIRLDPQVDKRRIRFLHEFPYSQRAHAYDLPDDLSTDRCLQSFKPYLHNPFSATANDTQWQRRTLRSKPRKVTTGWNGIVHQIAVNYASFGNISLLAIPLYAYFLTYFDFENSDLQLDDCKIPYDFGGWFHAWTTNCESFVRIKLFI